MAQLLVYNLTIQDCSNVAYVTVHLYVLFVSQSNESQTALVRVVVSQSHYTMTMQCVPYLLGYEATVVYQPLTLVTSTRPFRGTTLTSSTVSCLLICDSTHSFSLTVTVTFVYWSLHVL